MSLKSEKQLNVIVILIHVSVFLYYKASVILFFGHHFRDLLIPTFMVVTILILICIIFLTIFCLVQLLLNFIVSYLKHIGLCFWFSSGAVQAMYIMHFMDTLLFSSFNKWEFCKKKTSSLVLSKVMSNDQKYNMSADQAYQNTVRILNRRFLDYLSNYFCLDSWVDYKNKMKKEDL